MFGLYNMFTGGNLLAGDDLRARRDAVHQRVDHPAAADGRLAVPRADLEGRRARAPQDHAVHALPDAGAGRRAGAGHRGLARAEQRIAGGLPLVYDPGLGLPADVRADADDGHDVHHVARRADHRARHRQRHVAADLRRHRRRPAVGRAHDVRPDADRPDRPAARAVPAGDDGGRRRGDRLRRARAPADHGAVRQARRRAAAVRRVEHAHPAEGQHGRRHPGDLRLVDPGVPGDDRRRCSSRARGAAR